jgi:magnesium chelatase subunit D
VIALQYPFSALVGQEDLRTALLVNAIDPAIGGVLVRGERGTAKSTAVRSLVGLLPEVEAVAGCPYSCDPAAPDPTCPAGPHDDVATARRPVRLVELPVGASIERVTGSLDVERALTAGVRAFEPGLLAAAHRGILYVDEVNLLADHLVDVLLDAAALGTNYVEREGVSVRHPALFLLVGTMNPEEGELRPQLLDRFGLSVEVRAPREPELRAEIVRRRLEFEADPDDFRRLFAADDVALRARVRAARAALRSVRLPDSMVELIAHTCGALEVDGMRADIVSAKTATALAALEGAAVVDRDHVRRAALLAIAHRRRRGPLEQPGLDEAELDRVLDGDDDEPPRGGGPPHGGGPRDGGRRETVPPGTPPADTSGSPAPAGDRGAAGRRDAPAPEGTDPPRGDFRPPRLELRGKGVADAGRRGRGAPATGRPIADRAFVREAGIALLPTLRAAAPHQRARGRDGRPGLALLRSDLRSPVHEGGEGALVVVVLDTSGSMGARRRMAAVKAATLAVLVDAYQRRDRVALVAARGAGAEVVLPPTSSVTAGARSLERLPHGGRTPLAAGLERAREVVRAERLRDSRRRALVLLVTDGRANAGGDDPALAAHRAAAALGAEGAQLAVIDSEQGPVRLGLARVLAEAAGAPLVTLADLERSAA